jgi:arylsulfatase A-like enzyme
MRKQSRRDFIKKAAPGASALYSGISLTGWSSGTKKRPIVTIVLTHDQGYRDLGCHGNDKIRTPSFDGFYEENIRLTNFYVCPLCSPTRASLLTGRYNYRTGVVDTWVGLAIMRPDEVTMAEVLRGVKYRTGIFGKWHLGDHVPLRPLNQGFEECLIHKGAGIGGRSNPPDNRYYGPVLYHNEEPKKYCGYCTDIFFSAAAEFIENHREEPFIAFIPTNVPYVPLEIRDEEVAPYTALGLDEITAKHYAMLINLDWNFGRLIDKLEDLKLADDTIVIFMSDNGPAYGESRYNAGLREAKGSVYDGGIKAPFFVRWPKKLKPGVDIDFIAAHIDVLPTILELCGIWKSRNVHRYGISLAPMPLGSSIEWPDRTLFFQQCRPDPEGIDRPRLFTNCVVRSQRYKNVMTAENRRERQTKAVSFEETEPYGMNKDPGEQMDISKEHPEIVRRMREDYEEWFLDVTKNLAPVHIYLGSPSENPVLLTNQDLHGPGAAASYCSWSLLGRNPEEEPDGYGVWNVKVVRSGRYRICLRFGPVGNDIQIPLKPGKAVFKLGPVSNENKIERSATQVSFLVQLDETKGSIESFFTGQRRDGKDVTPFFIEVEYLGH